MELGLEGGEQSCERQVQDGILSLQKILIFLFSVNYF